MANQKLFLFCFFLLPIILFSTNGLAAITCDVSTTCDAPSITVFETSFFLNAHAQLPGQVPSYPYKVCCSGESTLGNSCSGNYEIALNLSSATNAHAEENIQTNPYYRYAVCLSSTYAGMVLRCEYASDCSGLGESYACLASISSITNAHVGGCGIYPIKVCCSVRSRCDGYVKLSINPKFAPPSSLAQPSASGLSSDCDGTVYFNQNSCSGTQVSSCIVSSGSCEGDGFSLPPVSGSYEYYACIDKNGDGQFNDPGEQFYLIYNVGYSSLPEFGWTGILQIIVLSTMVLFIVKRKF